MPIRRHDMLKELRALAAAAHRARAETAKQARPRFDELVALHPVPRQGARRARAAELLYILDEPRTRGALGYESFEDLVAKTPIPLRTAQRLRGEHARRVGKPTPAAAHALARAEAEIRAHLLHSDEHVWQAGAHFAQVADAKLHLAAGFTRLDDYADLRFPTRGFRTLQRHARLARNFTLDTVRRHGVVKLDLALEYLDLTPAEDRPADLPRLQIEVPGRGRVPFETITIRDLTAANRALARKQARQTAARLPRGAAPIAARVSKSFAQLDPRPRLTTRTTRIEGKTVPLLTFHDVSIAALPALARAIDGAR